ncbi:N-alpha-acetyltransferase 10/11 [Nematocida sp. AWRm77]|nr:N-alpha-acetyltransferase 10/11 [Nematocida sp. AWRm77]
MGSIILRAMAVGDIFSVAECNRRNLPENYQFIFLMYVILTSSHACFVAETSSGSIVGYVISKPRDGMEEKEALTTEHPVGYVISLAVDKAYRRKGLGKALLSVGLHGLCADLFSQGPSAAVYLNVRVSNTTAIDMYKKSFGFQEEMVEKEYYANKEDALVMSRIFIA